MPGAGVDLWGYVAAARRVPGAGVDLRGCFAWSLPDDVEWVVPDDVQWVLLDDVEWAVGYGKRFGMSRVGADTEVRTAKTARSGGGT
nr:family 1 glycosylhydrolase [uncultured Actinoplanes sp.]